MEMMSKEEIEKRFDKMFEKAYNDFCNNYIDYSIEDGREALMYFMAWSTFAQMCNVCEQ